MFTILEKTILLKTVDLFQDIPGELLSQISQISSTKNYEQGEVIFKEGDSGDSMFIVINGEVSIKKKEKIIAKLEKGASLGEMALLDNEPRSADAVADKDSVLLKINQDVFYELMEGNADIMKQIVRLLTSRLRDANSRLEQSLK
jgi:CRP-like cAMP-binding protein